MARPLPSIQQGMPLHRRGLCCVVLLLGMGGLPQFAYATCGTNNKIKTMKRQAYGYRDEEYFKLKLFALHESKFQLIG